MREVRASERWIERAASLHLKIEGKWTRTPEGVEAHKASLIRQGIPAEDVTVEKYPELLSERHDRLEIAFDGRRLFESWRLPEGPDVFLDTRIFDGAEARTFMRQRGREYFSKHSDPIKVVGDMLLPHLSWLRAGPHRCWWLSRPDQAALDWIGRPEDLSESAGRTSAAWTAISWSAGTARGASTAGTSALPITGSMGRRCARCRSPPPIWNGR